MLGGTVCRSHGGNAPQVRAKAKQRQLEQAARRLLPAEYREHPDPLGEALRTLSEAVAFKDAVRSLVGDLGVLRYEGHSGEQLRAEVAVYERALDRVGSMCERLIRLDIETRLTRVEEAKVMLVADVIRRVLDRHRVDPIVLVEIATELAQVSA